MRFLELDRQPNEKQGRTPSQQLKGAKAEQPRKGITEPRRCTASTRACQVIVNSQNRSRHA